MWREMFPLVAMTTWKHLSKPYTAIIIMQIILVIIFMIYLNVSSRITLSPDQLNEQ